MNKKILLHEPTFTEYHERIVRCLSCKSVVPTGSNSQTCVHGIKKETVGDKYEGEEGRERREEGRKGGRKGGREGGRRYVIPTTGNS